MQPDHLNALFEAGGAVALLFNLRRLYRDKTVKGVSAVPAAFFTAWGFANLWFYPAVGAPWSFRAGIAVCAVNLTWLAMAARYAVLGRQTAVARPPECQITDCACPGKYTAYATTSLCCVACARAGCHLSPDCALRS